MTPLSFEWKWIVDYFIFMGFFYLAIAIIGIGLVVAYIRAWYQIESDKKETSDISTRSKYSTY